METTKRTNPADFPNSQIFQTIKQTFLLYPNVDVPEQVIMDLAKVLGEIYEEHN